MVRDVFTAFLQEKNLKMTHQRELILREFIETDHHVAAEDLYDQVKSKDPSIGQATIYRTLKLLAQAGIAREVTFGDGYVRYEHKLGRKHHDHLVCEICKKSIEVFDPKIESLQEELAGRYGFRMTEHKMFLYGVCSECQ